MVDEAEWLPLVVGFDRRWRGWCPGQVQAHLDRVEADVRMLITDRDAAIARAQDLHTQLAECRSRAVALERELNRVCRMPIDAAGLEQRLQRRIRIAEAEAEAIVASAKASAQRRWTEAQAAAERLETCHEQLVAEAYQLRADAERECRELVKRAQAEAEELVQEAETEGRRVDASEVGPCEHFLSHAPADRPGVGVPQG